MALNFQVFDPTFQTSNFYTAIAQIEKSDFLEGVYPVFDWSEDYAIFLKNEDSNLLREFLQKSIKEYQFIWEVELEQWTLLIIHPNDNSKISLPILLEQAKVYQDMNNILNQE